MTSNCPPNTFYAPCENNQYFCSPTDGFPDEITACANAGQYCNQDCGPNPIQYTNPCTTNTCISVTPNTSTSVSGVGNPGWGQWGNIRNPYIAHSSILSNSGGAGSTIFYLILLAIFSLVIYGPKLFNYFFPHH